MSGLTTAATQGYEVGRASGGSGLSSALTALADRLKQQREQQETSAQQQNILGMTEASKMRVAQAEDKIITNRIGKIPENMEVSGYSSEGRPYFRAKKPEAALPFETKFETKKVPPYQPSEVSSWGEVPITRRIKSALTPSATPEEKKLGGLRVGGVFKPPKIGETTKNDLRSQAIEELQNAGYPITEANIKVAIQQLGG